MTPAVQPLNYPLSTAALWLAPNYASRAAAVAAGLNVPAYNPSLPIKGWVLPAGGQFAYFDPQNAAGGYVSYLPPMSDAQAQALNLPGAAPVVAYVVAPCQISWAGGIADVSGFVCNKADALSVMAMIQPLYPGVSLSLIETDQGAYAFQYAAGETRREWVIEPIAVNAQDLTALMNWPGVGLPGSFAKNPGGSLVWNGGQQVTAAPAGAIYLPTPIRPLLAGEQIVPARSLPGSNTFQVTNVAAQIALLQSLIAKYTAQLQALQAA